MPDIDALRLFAAIARCESIAPAARALRLSPSVASRRLSALEAELGASLLLRSTRSAQLTEAGRRFLAWAERTLAGYDEIYRDLALEADEPVGTVRVAANDYMGPRYLVDAVQQFRARHPGVHLVLSLQDDPISAIKLGYDIAIHAGPTPGETYVGRRILAYRRIVCAAPDYLDRRGIPVSPNELDAHDCLVHFRNDTHRWVFKDFSGRVRTKDIRPVVETNSYPMLLDLAVRRLGVIRIADIIARPAIARGDLQEVLTTFRSIEPDGGDPAIWLTYGERPRLPRVRLVADFLLSQLKDL